MMSSVSTCFIFYLGNIWRIIENVLPYLKFSLASFYFLTQRPSVLALLSYLHFSCIGKGFYAHVSVFEARISHFHFAHDKINTFHCFNVRTIEKLVTAVTNPVKKLPMFYET